MVSLGLLFGCIKNLPHNFFFFIRGWCYFSWQELSNQRHCCIMGKYSNFFVDQKWKKNRFRHISNGYFSVTQLDEVPPSKAACHQSRRQQAGTPTFRSPATSAAPRALQSDSGLALRYDHECPRFEVLISKVRRALESSPSATLHQLDVRLLHHHLFTRSSETSGE